MPINKVRVKDKTTGKWKSKTVPTLILARQFETKFKTEDIIKEQAPSLVPLKDSPTVSEIWSAYLAWAKLNKKSWHDDEIRWNKHIISYLPVKVSQITPKDHMLRECPFCDSINTIKKGYDDRESSQAML